MEDAQFAKSTERPVEKITSTGWIIFFSIVGIVSTVLALLFVIDGYGYNLYIGMPGMLGFALGFLIRTSRNSVFFKTIGYLFLFTLLLSLILVGFGINGAFYLLAVLFPLYIIILLGFTVGTGLRRMSFAKSVALPG